MKKLLLLNGGHSEITLIKEAQRLGYYVITSGNDPRLIGHKLADENIFEDYSNYEKMLQIAENNKIDAVVSCANDFGAISAAYIAEKMGLPGHDSFKTTTLLHQKDSFKHFAKANNIQVAPSVEFSNIEDALKFDEYTFDYPMIVKPTDLTGGKGVSKAENREELTNAIAYAFEKTRKGSIVVEHFVEGSYHSFSTFVVNRKVIASYSDNEYSYINPFFVAASGGPARNISKIKELLIGQVEKIAELLNLVNGVFHIQYVMDENNIPYIMDITRRCSGDLYPEPVEHSTGLPWSKWIVLSETGSPDSSFMERGEQKIYCGRCCVMPKRNGVVSNVIIPEEIRKHVYKEIMWWKEGDLAKNYLADKCGILFWEFDSEEEMLSVIRDAFNKINVVVY